LLELIYFRFDEFAWDTRADEKTKIDYSGLQKFGTEFGFNFNQVENNKVTAAGQAVQVFKLILYEFVVTENPRSLRNRNDLFLSHIKS
jgi:hypothetical protein